MAVREKGSTKRSNARNARARKALARKKIRSDRSETAQPHLSLVRAPADAPARGRMQGTISVATYNVHRWSGAKGRGAPDPSLAGFVISELRADIIALQEVLRPHEEEDPLEALADALGLHVAFASTRIHKRGEIGNAVLSRWPMTSVSVLNLSFSRIEKRLAMAAQFAFGRGGVLDVVATHLALGDRTRHLQVRSLLDHPQFQGGPTLLLGDMNAWRKCPATRALDDELHHNLAWPPSFPAARPVLALDRIYSRGVHVKSLESHATSASRKASDHLPVIATIELPE
jgi:endonuclease/exonuclease/phosphatase family metal-dependent hydrolase